MQIAAVQFDVSWEDPKTSILSVSTMLARADLPVGTLVVLPEMFATGFSMNAEMTLRAQAETQAALCELAGSLNLCICGGLVAANQDGQAENQAVVYTSDGKELARYTKRHPFTPLREDTAYQAGREVTTFRWNETVLSPLICYDLRFPEEFRTAVRKGAEVFLVLANWPAVRQDHWTTLLRARAIENQAYVIGVNRTGQDPHCQYAGGSLIVSPRGEILAQAGASPQILSADLDIEALRSYRAEFPALVDMDSRIL